MITLLNKISDAGIVLEIVDGKLKLFAGDIDIDKALLDEIRANKEEITSYLIDTGNWGGQSTNNESIPALATQEAYALSPGQLGLWLTSRLTGGAEVYNTIHKVILEGEYNRVFFEKAIIEAINRHEILRTVFKENEEGVVHQYIIAAEALDFKIDFQDFRNFHDKTERAEAYINEDVFKVFDLENGPLMRAILLQLEDDRYMFYYNLHHIISDGWLVY